MDRSEIRQPVKRIPLSVSQRRDVEYIDFVVNMGFVEDKKRALLLSAAGQNYMDCLLVKDAASAMNLYHRGVKTWSLDQIPIFKIKTNDGRRPRNDSERQRKELPLPPPSFSKGPCPEYLVNLIDLPSEMEHYRDTVFYAIYGTSLLFEELDAAMEYRKDLVNQNLPIPDIWTIHGDRLSSKGILNPKEKVDFSGENLRFIYGQMSPQLNEEYRIIENDLAVIQLMKEKTEEKAAVLQRLSELESVPGLQMAVQVWDNDRPTKRRRVK